MKLETFFEKFDLFSDTPDAIAKLRELLTHAAVNGRLVPNDPNEKPVGLKLPKPSGQQSALPSNWRFGRLGDVFVFEYGNNLPAPKRSQSGDYPVYGSNGVVGTHDSYLTKEPAIIVGRKGSAGALNIATGPSWTTDVAYFVRPPKDLDLRFTYYLFSTLRFADLGKGIKPGLSRKEAYELPIALPPLAEQKRIVLKVDELMELCDRLEAQQQERETRHTALARASLARFADAPTVANLDLLFHKSYSISPADLRKSILTLAVQGKLVPQEVEPSVGSLDSILAEASVNGVSKGPTFDKSATEILRISAGTSRGDFYVNEDDFKHVDLPANEIEKFQLAPGDLLACRFNGNLHYVGRFSYYRGESGRVQVNPDKLIRFRIKTESHCPRYVCLAMNAAPTREAIEAMCATTAGNIGLSAGRLKTVEIPLPHLAEQRRIVEKVDELMALVDALETQLATAHNAGATLIKAAVSELTAAA